MKKIFFAVVLCFLTEAAFGFTIATGPNDGTYFQIAQDIKNLAAKEGIEVEVTPSKGSLENLQLLGNGKVNLALVQLDALRLVSDVMKQSQGKDLFDRVRIVLNLYPEEIHVLTNKSDIKTFYQLEGKRVSVGTQGGGSAISAAVLFHVYDINATVSFESFDEAVKKIEQGALDAVIFVGGSPIPFIDKLGGKLQFVRLPASPALEQLYFRTRLGKAQYKWAQDETETYAVPSAIMGLEDRDPKYVSQLQRLVLTVLNGRQSLEANGHPKWKSAIIDTYFPARGFEPTNQMIQMFNALDSQGYKIVKK